jgi:mannose-1-phosphate guanylyltransferase
MGNAAACGLVSSLLYKRDPESTAIFLPSDHMIKEPKKFLNIVDYAGRIIEKYPEQIVLIGINPTEPDTGLGYIQINSQVDKSDGLKAFTVRRFIEKPNLEKAKQYVSSWEYLWNSGMFIWKNKRFLDLIDKNMPATALALRNIMAANGTPEDSKVLKTEYAKVDVTSVDYGIMEKTKEIMVIPSDFGWSDIGSWGTLLKVLSETHSATIITKGHHVGVNNKNCLILANDKLIATVGLKDIVIVDTPDALLVCNSERSHEVKDLLAKLKDEGKHFYL